MRILGAVRAVDGLGLALSIAAHAGVVGVASYGVRAAPRAEVVGAPLVERVIAVEEEGAPAITPRACPPPPEPTTPPPPAPAPRVAIAPSPRPAARPAAAPGAPATPSASPAAASSPSPSPSPSPSAEAAPLVTAPSGTTAAASAEGAATGGGGLGGPAAPAASRPGPAQPGTGDGDMPGYLRALHGRLARLVQFPDEAARAAHQGTVVVRLVLLADGSLASADVVGGDGDASLRDAALAAASRARPFAPPPAAVLEAGRVAIQIPLRFVLKPR
jgi:TonB family protein